MIADHFTDLHYDDHYDEPKGPVVLGRAANQATGLDAVYRNAPQSLREVEDTISVETSDST